MSSWLIKNYTKKTKLNITNLNIHKEIYLPANIDNSNVNNDIIDYNNYFSIVNKINKTNNNFEFIPKIAFTFWEGKQFSYLHYLTIKSFLFYNPEFKVIIYNTINETDIDSNWDTPEFTKYISNNICNINLLKNISNVSFITINLEDYFKNTINLSVIHKSDIIRIIKLKEHGGIWLDFDILFFKKIPEDLLKLHKNDIGIFKSTEVLLIGLIFSHPNNPIFDYLIEQINKLLNNLLHEKDKYQQFGTRIWTKLLRLNILKNYIKILNNDIVYSYEWNYIDNLYKSNNDITNNSTIGIHWFNGTNISKDYINTTDFNNINPNESVINKYVFKVLQDINNYTEYKE